MLCYELLESKSLCSAFLLWDDLSACHSGEDAHLHRCTLLYLYIVCLKISVGFESVLFFFSMIGLLWSRYSSVSHTMYHSVVNAIYHHAHIHQRSPSNRNNWIGTRERQDTSDPLDCSGKTEIYKCYECKNYIFHNLLQTKYVFRHLKKKVTKCKCKFIKNVADNKKKKAAMHLYHKYVCISKVYVCESGPKVSDLCLYFKTYLFRGNFYYFTFKLVFF